jgi:U3 small nucleolar ribonucleoprotein protein IMP4
LKKKVIISTSREPSPRTRSFVKDISNLAYWLIKINRGKMTFHELVEEAILADSNTLAVVGEMRGNPSIIRVYDLTDVARTEKLLHTYSIILKGVALSRETGNHGVEPQEVNEIIIEPSQGHDEESKALVLALHQMLNTGVEPPREGKYIKVNINTAFKLVKFKLFPTGLNVGPVIKYFKVKTPKKLIELGEAAEDSQI